ncbi:MAG TPA: pitrilysin family protein [Gammaproteobacteria bacterium]|nr:pitrilysin family protein [Gammaproteobacteria bacterium]
MTKTRLARPTGIFWALILGLAVGVGGMPTARAKTHKGDPSQVLRATLKNGLRVVIVRNDLAPVVTTELNYLVGSNEAPKGFPGTAHAQEHMMFRGSPGLSAAQLADITAAMGGNFDADTQQSVTQYFFTVPAEDVNVALHIGAIRMRGVLDSQTLWSKERGAIEQEVARDLSSPEYVMYTKILAAMFKGTPYAHDALGTRPSFDKTTGAMLKRFHQRWYAPNNAILIVVGHIEPKKTLAEIKRLYGDIPAQKLPKRPSVHLQPVQKQSVHLKTDSPYGLAAIAFRMPGYDSPDYAACEVLADVLSSQRGKLFDLVTHGQALGTGFDMNPFRETGLGFAYAAFPKGGDDKALLKSVRGTLAQIIKDGVPPDLVAAAKRQARSGHAFQRNSIPGLASIWSQALAVEGRRSPDDDMRAIEKVSVADVNRVARRYLDEDHAIEAVLTPQGSGGPSRSQGFGGKESFAPKQTKPVKLPDWAQKALGQLNVPASVVNPVVKVLPNGVKLIVQHEDISNTISVYGRVHSKASMETPKGEEGVSSVLGQLFDYGTTSLDRVAFQKALDDIGASESAGTDFSVQVLRPDFERGVQLLADNVLRPALPKRAFEVVKRQTARAVAGQLQSPGFLVHQSLKKALFPSTDPSLRHATPDSVKALTRADVVAYHKKVFRPDMTTIVVIGKVTPAEAETVIGKYFGHWKAKGPKPDTDLPQVPDNMPATAHVPDSSRVQDRVVLAETLKMNRFNPDYYALKLGNHVLGGAFYATRLYHDLREERGLVYTVGSGFQFGPKRSVYVAGYACDPDNVSKARNIIVRDLEQMRVEPVTPTELRQAKALLLREIPLSEASMGDIAGGLLDRADRGLPLDEPTRAARRYVKLTARQVQVAYEKWLRPTDLVEVSQGPKPK